MLKRIKKSNGSEKGFTLIELLVVAAIIGILLAIAIPNLIKARISANEASARKAMQTLRDAEGEYFEQDLNDDGERNYTGLIGNLSTAESLRNPEGTGVEQDSLIDISFEGADSGADPSAANCADSKAGYCIGWDAAEIGGTAGNMDDFGWEASMTSFRKTGRKDYAVYGDGVIRCTVTGQTSSGQPGDFNATRSTGACD